MQGLVIAIDGPAGAGKSTIAKIVAKKLGYVYIDTGAMYRAVAWKVLAEKKLDDEMTDAFIINAAKNIDIDLKYENDKTVVRVNGTDVTNEIRTPEVSGAVSQVAKLPEVREKMVTLQRKMGENGAIVMDGRDIASHVLPNADVKIFLTASIDERARRRCKEMTEKGYDVSLDEIKRDIAARDKADTERKVSPLVRVPDAELVDTTGMSIDEVTQKILSIAEAKRS
ncbi:MAG: (d)CMP kinase [Selenomonadaceae bacterium]